MFIRWRVYMRVEYTHMKRITFVDIDKQGRERERERETVPAIAAESWYDVKLTRKLRH